MSLPKNVKFGDLPVTNRKALLAYEAKQKAKGKKTYPKKKLDNK